MRRDVCGVLMVKIIGVGSTMQKRILITDVDNTLFDWVDIWYKSFSSMLVAVSNISGIPEEDLYPSISKIHQRHGTSEYAFLLEELPELRDLYGSDILKTMYPAIEAFRSARKSALLLYPSVEESLLELKKNGITIVAYTESQAFYTQYRFRKLGLDRIIDYLYSPPDHELPVGDARDIRKYSDETYVMSKTISRVTPKGELKPNPRLLETIISEIGAVPDEVVYIGDSKMKDIPMAQEAHVLDVWARYGQAQHRQEYELLRKVTHWTAEDVEREKSIMNAADVRPTIVATESFSEVLSLF